MQKKNNYLIKISSIIFFYFLVFLFFPNISFANDISLKKGVVEITNLSGKKQPITVHTYRSSDLFNVNSHIIESKNAIVIIDVQATLENAREVREYAEKLNKKIVAVLITHSHPDHYMGLEVFKDIASYAAVETINSIKKRYGNDLILLQNMGVAEIPETMQLPTKIINSSITFDNVIYDTASYPATHGADDVTVFMLKSYQAVFSGDLLATKHLLMYDFDKYEEAVIDLQKMNDYQHAFLGHEAVTGFQSVLKLNLEYIRIAKKSIAKSNTAEEYIKEMEKLYPNYSKISSFQLPMLKERYFK